MSGKRRMKGQPNRGRKWRRTGSRLIENGTRRFLKPRRISRIGADGRITPSPKVHSPVVEAIRKLLRQEDPVSSSSSESTNA